MRNYLGFLGLGLLSIFLLSCNGEKSTVSGSDSGTSYKLPASYESEVISEDLQYVSLTKGEYLKVEGYIRKGQQDGVWIYYYPDRRKIQRIEPYNLGKLHGFVKEFSLNGNMTLFAEYKDGLQDGIYQEYKFGYPLATATFKAGNLDGARLIYFSDKDNLGTVQQKIQYSDGVKSGLHQYFNDKGEVVLEYEYKDGERIE